LWQHAKLCAFRGWLLHRYPQPHQPKYKGDWEM